MQIPVNQFETYADGLDHAEDLAFDSEGILWAGGEIGQVYRIPEKGQVPAHHPGEPSYTGRNQLFDIVSDPRQVSSLVDPALETHFLTRIAAHLQACEAPLEQYARVGIAAP